MKLLNNAILFILLLFAGVVNAQQKESATYYITKTGAKYHKGDCHYLKYSKIAVKTNEKRFSQYTPCKVCKPPSKVKSTLEYPKKSAAEDLCVVITKEGIRCDRTARTGKNKCWLHE